MMETKFKDKVKGSNLYGMLKSVEAGYQRVTGKFLFRASEAAATSFTPHEVPEVQSSHA